MRRSAINRLQQWYAWQCDGDWEHGAGIHIATLDNPGWHMTVNLVGTDLEDRPFSTVELNRTDRNWLYCRVAEDKFEGACGPNNLHEMVTTFLDWAAPAGSARAKPKEATRIAHSGPGKR